MQVCMIFLTAIIKMCSISCLRFKIPNKIPVNLHNGASYDYHFNIKKINIKYGKEINKAIAYTIKSIDSARFMRDSH